MILRAPWRRAALALLIAVVAAIGPRAGRVATFAQAAAPKPQPKLKLCAWPSAAVGATRFGNTGWIDTRGTYLLQKAFYLPGSSMSIHGLFPYARFMSITVYAGRSGAVAGRLSDYQIVPNRGSVNPFLPHANRQARQRAYTIYLRQGPAPSHPAVNTIYTGPYHPVLIMYRVYAPDAGANEYGQVPKPSIDLWAHTAQGTTSLIHEPVCASPQKARGTAGLKLSVPMRWYRVGAQSKNGVNVDEAYLVTRLNSYDAQVYVVRFKAPTFPDTYQGHAIAGNEDVRFWSLCQYDMRSQRVVACLHDYQAVRGAAGYVTVVLSTEANRPKSATQKNGVNWLPFGPEQVGLLMYRQLLPNTSFHASIANLDPSAYPFEMQLIMGRYLPTILTCSQAAFTPTSCNDQVNPLLCNDLIEPAPCSAPRNARRDVARIGGAHGRW